MKLLFVCILSLALTIPAAGQKRTVAVEEFNFSAVMTEIQTIFGTQTNLGRGIRALMVKRITQGGKFTVVERAALKTLMDEQNLGASGRVKRGTQARIGELSGAQFTLLGDIVTFGRDDQRKRAGGVVVVPGAAVGGAGYKSDFKAVVTITFRLVNTETSETVMSGEARGESKRESKGGIGGLIVGGVGVGGGFDSTSSNFAETIIGEAVIDACNKLAVQIENQSGQVSSTINAQIEGRVAAVQGATVYLNVGSTSGVQVGDTFTVSHIVNEVRDPVTKEVLDLQTSPAGEMKITTVREKIAIGTMNGGEAKVGDRAEKKQ